MVRVVVIQKAVWLFAINELCHVVLGGIAFSLENAHDDIIIQRDFRNTELKNKFEILSNLNGFFDFCRREKKGLLVFSLTIFA